MMKSEYNKLKQLLKEMGSTLIAFSGGVDSSLLLAAAYDALNDNVLAVTAISPMLPVDDLKSAQKIASYFGARWVTVETNEINDPAFASNPVNRCYLCKKMLFTLLLQMAQREQMAFVIEGSNKDDLVDFRPGLAAIRELGIRSPYVELGIGKDLIRQMAKERGLENWNRSSSACLASRIPYGEPITRERLHRIGQSEQLLRDLGFQQVRVRDHGTLARIEIAPQDLKHVFTPQTKEAIIAGCKKAGYVYVALDLDGYRTGAMNEIIKKAELPEIK